MLSCTMNTTVYLGLSDGLDLVWNERSISFNMSSLLCFNIKKNMAIYKYEF